MSWRHHHDNRNDYDTLLVRASRQGEPPASGIVGARRLCQQPDDSEHGVLQPAWELWRLTDKLEDLLIGETDFVPGETFAAVAAELERKYPSAIPEATRLMKFPDRGNVLVLRVPLCDRLFRTRKKNKDKLKGESWKHDFHEVWEPALVEKAMAATVLHGDLLVTAAVATKIRGCDDFDGSELVFFDLPGVEFSILKYRPSKAKARRTRAENVIRKNRRAAEEMSAATTMLQAAAKACGALLEDLHMLRIAEDPVVLLKHALAEYPHYRRYTYDPRTEECGGTLLGVVYLHRKLFGRFAYRRKPEFQDLLTAYRARPQSLPDAKWGCNFPAFKEFLEAESKKKPPRPAPDPEAEAEAEEGPTDVGALAEAG